ncbi:MAG: hypothetical protein ACRD1P_07465 [Thermoanaerobaculia bacterium]
MSEPKCSECGLDVTHAESRMAEMPPDAETGTRIWRRIGRVYYHPGGRICDQVIAEVKDVVRRKGG